jgi:5-methylcytosine-specific restriction enzyme A
MSPWAPKKPCAAPGCGALVPSGVRRCPRHEAVEAERRRQYDRSRATDPVRQFEMSWAWRRVAKRFLEANPVCSVLGCGEAARHADHRTPVRVLLRQGGDPLDESGLQPMCARHHSSKTARSESWGRKTQ